MSDGDGGPEPTDDGGVPTDDGTVPGGGDPDPTDDDDGAVPGDSPPNGAPDPSATAARSPSTDPRAPDPESPRRRLVVVGVVVLMLAASVGGVAWAVTQTSGSSPTVPTVTIEHAYEGDSRTTLTHAGGDEVRAGNVVVAVDGERASWADLRFGVAADDTIRAGDTVLLHGVEPGDEITVYYVAGDVEATLATITVHESG